MAHPVWCVHCQRVWDAGALKGTWPQMLCPDSTCNDARPGAFMPYARTRALIAPHWPEQPLPGQRLALTARRHPDTEGDAVG